MNGKSYKWLMKSLGSLSLASTVVMLPIILAGCSDDSSSSTVPLPPPPPPPRPPAPPAPPPAPPAPTPTPTPGNLLLSVVVTRTSSGGSGLGEQTGLLPGGTVTGVSINSAIRFRFGTPVNEAPLLQALSLRASSGATVAPALDDFKFNSDRTEVVWTPPATLQNDQTYTLTITARPDLFADGRPLFPSPQTFTFTTGATAVGPGPLSILPTQFAALTPNGQIFSSPNVIPVGYGIRRTGVSENLPVGVYADYRSVLSFPLPSTSVVPANAVVQTAQLTLVQLPSSLSTNIPAPFGVGDVGTGFFFLDPTPHNIPANNVVFQEVNLGSPNNVVSSDFFAPVSAPSFIALSINGNVLFGDVSAGPRIADVTPGVQRAVSGNRFYQIRLQCAREVWNNQAAPVFLVTTGRATITTTGIVTATQRFNVTATQTFAIAGSVSATFSNAVTGALTLPITQSVSATASISGTVLVPGPTPFTVTVSGTITVGQTVFLTVGFGATSSFSATVSASAVGTVVGSETRSETVTTTGSVVATTTTAVSPFTVTAPNPGFEISQGSDGVCRAEFDREPATGTGLQPITTARGPRLDITFTVPR